MASDSQEIWEVYSGEIASKSKQVFNKFGAAPFLDGLDGMQTEPLMPLHPDVGDVLTEVLNRDREKQQNEGYPLDNWEVWREGLSKGED